MRSCLRMAVTDRLHGEQARVAVIAKPSAGLRSATKREQGDAGEFGEGERSVSVVCVYIASFKGVLACIIDRPFLSLLQRAVSPVADDATPRQNQTLVCLGDGRCE